MEDNIRVMGVDPGNNLGVAIIDYNLKTGIFKVMDAYTLDMTRYIPNSDDTDKRDISLQRLTEIKHFLKEYIRVWKPDIAAHETAYVPHGGGGSSIYSYASLVENILTIKFSFIELASDVRIFEVNPTTMKICIVGVKSSDKSLVLKALISDDNINLDDIDVTKLNQHNTDSIGIAVTCIRENVVTKFIDGEPYFNYRGKKDVKRKK